jgi:hypothetical protein
LSLRSTPFPRAITAVTTVTPMVLTPTVAIPVTDTVSVMVPDSDTVPDTDMDTVPAECMVVRSAQPARKPALLLMILLNKNL